MEAAPGAACAGKKKTQSFAEHHADSPLLLAIQAITMGPQMITHTYFYYWEILSQLHRTSVTQGFLAGCFLV